MATKTITIDLEAYSRLKKAKLPSESFSQTIKRVVKPPFDFKKWLRKMADDPISPQTAEAIEQQVRNRRRPSTRER